MKTIYAQEPLPDKKSDKIISIFLAGPTPRVDTKIPSWRPKMLGMLEKLEFSNKLQVLVPESRSGEWNKNYLNQVDWEEEAIGFCDILVFWIPRDITNGMPGFTTNVEFGYWLEKKSNIILGYPPGADKCRYIAYKFSKQFPNKTISLSLKETVEQIEHLIKKENKCG